MSGRLTWRGDALYRNGSRIPLLRLEPDGELWRVIVTGKTASDIVNYTRARDAARAIAEKILTVEDHTHPSRAA